MTPTEKQLIVISILVVCPILGVFVYGLWDWIVNDFLLLGGLNTGDYYKNNKIYGPTTSKPASAPIVYRKAKNTTSLLSHERKCPPRPAFFGRLDGQYLESIGEYEEKYLNSFELSHWQAQKRLNGTTQTDPQAKTPEVLDIKANLEQNPEIVVDFNSK